MEHDTGLESLLWLNSLIRSLYSFIANIRTFFGFDGDDSLLEPSVLMALTELPSSFFVTLT